MVQSPSWEANWFAASQEIPRISRNPKVHYRTHKPPPPVSILGQPNPAHIPTFHLLEIRLYIIHPSTHRSPQWSLSLRFPHQEPIQLSPHPFSPAKDPVTILQEAGWAAGKFWTGGKSRTHRDLIPDYPTRSQSLYRLSYPAHIRVSVQKHK